MTGKIKKIISTENGDSFVADIEDIENRITQNSSNLESAKTELSNKCNEALSEAKAYTDTEKANFVKKSGDVLTGEQFVRNVNNSSLHLMGGVGWFSGASLLLMGKDHELVPGSFRLDASSFIDNDATKGKFSRLQGTPDGALTWAGKNVVRSVNGVNADAQGNVQLGNSGAITGEIKWFAFNTVPDGYIICNGAKVSRETYADLFAAIGTAFGDGDGSTTFDLPDLIDRFAQGSRTVGTYKSAGLPNITGTIPYMLHADTSAINNTQPESGAFKAARFMDTSLASQTTSATRWVDPTFDASRSNSIYGNSTTVQPPTLTLLPCIKY